MSVLPSNRSKPVVLSELERTLLTLLHSRSLYGTEFVDTINKLSDGERDLKFGSLYPTLKRMEDKGYVTCRWGDETNGPRRKYYDITEDGRRLVEEDRAFSERCWEFTRAQRHTFEAPLSADPVSDTTAKPTLTKTRR